MKCRAAPNGAKKRNCRIVLGGEGEYRDLVALWGLRLLAAFDVRMTSYERDTLERLLLLLAGESAAAEELDDCSPAEVRRRLRRALATAEEKEPSRTGPLFRNFALPRHPHAGVFSTVIRRAKALGEELTPEGLVEALAGECDARGEYGAAIGFLR